MLPIDLLQFQKRTDNALLNPSVECPTPALPSKGPGLRGEEQYGEGGEGKDLGHMVVDANPSVASTSAGVHSRVLSF